MSESSLEAIFNEAFHWIRLKVQPITFAFSVKDGAKVQVYL